MTIKIDGIILLSAFFSDKNIIPIIVAKIILTSLILDTYAISINCMPHTTSEYDNVANIPATIPFLSEYEFFFLNQFL